MLHTSSVRKRAWTKTISSGGGGSSGSSSGASSTNSNIDSHRCSSSKRTKKAGRDELEWRGKSVV